MKTAHLTPAYGRDYRSKKEILADLEADKDFIFHDISSPWDGSPCNATNLREHGYSDVQVRYRRNLNVTVLKLPAKQPDPEPAPTPLDTMKAIRGKEHDGFYDDELAGPGESR